jgi:recombination endonuclease VII
MRKKYKRDKDFTNFRIGNLVLLSRTGDSRLSGRSKDYEWECRCDCGNVCRYFIKRLRHANNVVKSCGICIPIPTPRELNRIACDKRKHKRRAEKLWRLYGMTVDDFNERLKGQKYNCAICLRPFGEQEMPYVDHDHNTGAVCGLTHRKCNSAIALLDENPWIMRLAADYVEAKKWHKEHGELLPLPKELTSKSFVTARDIARARQDQINKHGSYFINGATPCLLQ